MIWEMLVFSMTSLAKAPLRVGDPLAFYEITATVVPLLFVGIVFQARAIDPEDWPKGRLGLAGILVVLATISSEAAALRVLSLQHPTHGAQTLIVVCALFLVFALLVNPVGEAIIEPLLEEIRGLSNFWVEVLAALALAAITVGAAIVGASFA